LLLVPGMVHRGEWAAIELPSDLRSGRVNRRGERAGGHDVDGTGEPVLGKHASTRLEQQHQPNARIVDEPEQRLLHPLLDGDSHGRTLT